MDISYQALKAKAYRILEEPTDGDLPSRVFDAFIIVLILLNVLAVIIESMTSVYIRYREFFRAFETFSVIVFTIEYVLRLWTITENPKYRRPLWGRLRFAVTPLAIIDLLAVLPYYLPFVFRIDLRFLRAVRLIRLFRLFKLGRYTTAINTFAEVLHRKKADLSITLFSVLLLVVLASSLLYLIEHRSGQAVFSSVPAAIWWAVARLTSLGYSDIFPASIAGKIVAIVIAIIGVGLFAVLGGILGSGFVEVMQHREREPQRCPHCGKEIPPPELK